MQSQNLLTAMHTWLLHIRFLTFEAVKSESCEGSAIIQFIQIGHMTKMFSELDSAYLISLSRHGISLPKAYSNNSLHTPEKFGQVYQQ